MSRSSNTLVFGALAALFAVGALAKQPGRTNGAQGYDQNVIYLDQAWSAADRNTFYWINQGTVMMSYDIFLNLEVAAGQERFRSDANIERFGAIPSPPDPQWNPDGLPVGIAKEVITEGRWKGTYAGINCAACHTGELFYHGKRIRIDGDAAAHFDMQAFYYAADDAMQATLRDSVKFDRLAASLGASSAQAKSELRERLEKDATGIHYYTRRILAPPSPWGPGRMDCLNMIMNRVVTIESKIPENWFPPLAPTKPPFIWNAPQGSWTQWSAIAQDPLVRNYGETLGVYMPMDLTSKTPAEGLFDSNARLLNLTKIEGLVARLAPPKWPEEVFGRIDRAKAAQGKQLFGERCAGCHNSYPYKWTEPNKHGKRFIEVGIVPQTYVGTDPMQFEDFTPYVQTAQLAPYMPGEFKDRPVVPTPVLKRTVSVALLETAVKKLNPSPEEALKLHGYREQSPHGPDRCYKAAPRDGIWAEPPYLHNGSVPNLYELLIPAAERTKKFYVGREFDPVKVGVDTSGKSGTFLVDTTLVGNSNAGHSFQDGPRGHGVIGPKLTDDQRWALIEYLKSIPEEAGRVTPYGGPSDAKSGPVKWGDASKCAPGYQGESDVGSY
jgi:mono/diheme cytochrome c family protein